jgi:apolipoprotein N-acyltransferase
MQHTQQHEISLAGAVMLLVGLLLILYLLGQITVLNILPLFLIGVGIIFSTIAFVKLRSPKSQYEMPPKAYLGYGLVAIVIGGLWLSASIQLMLAEIVLAGILILFGVGFILYSATRR